MDKIEDGGPAFPCGKVGCLAPAVRTQGHQRLCARHYRFAQMRSLAKRRGKEVPAVEDLCSMPGVNLTCPDCGRKMNWLSGEGRSTVASLQHYRDGSLAIVCRSCNTRHASMDGDSYRTMHKDHKACPRCQQVKPASEFTADNSRSGELRRKSICRRCSHDAVTAWKEKNRDQYNEYQRQYRARRKDAGHPVSRGS